MQLCILFPANGTYIINPYQNVDNRKYVQVYHVDSLDIVFTHLLFIGTYSSARWGYNRIFLQIHNFLIY